MINKVIDYFLILLATLFAIVNIAYLYTEFYLEKPITSTTSYVSNVIDPVTNEKTSFLKLNHYRNVNNTGKEVFEFSFSSYTDIYKNAVITSGVQIITEENEEGKLVDSVYYYTSFNGISFASVPDLDRGVEQLVKYGTNEQKFEYGTEKLMLVEIDGKMYGVALDGTYTVVTKGFDLWKSVGSFFKAFGNFGMYQQEEHWHHYEEYTYPYTYLDFFNSVKNSLVYSSEGYGSYTLSLVDLSKYFSLYLYNEETLQFDKLPATTFYSSYFSVDCNTSRYGLVRSNQSMFKMVENNFEYNIGNSSGTEDFWKMKVAYIVTENDFRYRKSKEDGLYYITVKTDLIDYLSNIENYDNLLIKVNLNIVVGDKIIGGIDMYGLYGLKIHSIDLVTPIMGGIGSPNVEYSFKFLDYSLLDTEVEEITTTDNVVLVFEDLYKGVVL